MLIEKSGWKIVLENNLYEKYIFCDSNGDWRNYFESFFTDSKRGQKFLQSLEGLPVINGSV